MQGPQGKTLNMEKIPASGQLGGTKATLLVLLVAVIICCNAMFKWNSSRHYQDQKARSLASAWQWWSLRSQWTTSPHYCLHHIPAFMGNSRRESELPVPLNVHPAGQGA